MRVKWFEIVELPESYWETVEHIEPGSLRHDYAGEVLGVVRNFGTTNLVVMTDEGKVREIAASKVKKAEA